MHYSGGVMNQMSKCALMGFNNLEIEFFEGSALIPGHLFLLSAMSAHNTVALK